MNEMSSQDAAHAPLDRPRVVIFGHDDVTTNIIFSDLIADAAVDVAAIYVGKSFDKKSSGKFDYVWSLLQRTPVAFVIFLSLLNIQYQVYRLMPSFLARRIGGRLGDMRRAARHRGIPVRVTGSFNDPRIIEAVRALAPDYLVIRMGEILKPTTLALAKKTTLCVHSSILPSCGGIAGEFHGIRTGAPLGTTIFEVTPELDKGAPLAIGFLECEQPLTGALKETGKGARVRASLGDLILDNNRMAAGLLVRYLLRPNDPAWARSRAAAAGIKDSYFSFPSRPELGEFRRQGGQLWGVAPFFEALRPVLHRGKIGGRGDHT